MTDPVTRVIDALNTRDLDAFVVQEERATGRGDAERHVAVYLVDGGVIARERLLR